MYSNNTLSALTEEQLADLYDWLSSESIASVQRRLMEPPPLGHNLKVHRNTLTRFYRERSRHERAETLADLQASPENPAHALTLFDSSHAALAHYTYTQAHGPVDPQSYNSMCRAIHRHQANILRQG